MGDMIHILFRDLLLSMLLRLTALVVFLIMAVNPPSAEDIDRVSPPGSIAVSIAWQEGPGDVDLWVKGPGDSPTSYRRRAGKLFSLLRDDRGVDGDSSPLNYENAYSRSIEPGEYIVNVHGYSLSGERKVRVEVAFGKTADEMRVIVIDDVVVKQGQELTVVRFTVGADGELVPESFHRAFISLRNFVG